MKPVYPPEMAPPEVSQRRADDLIAWLRGYAEERIDSRLFDERRCVPPFVILDFGNRGILGMQIPERFGGLALRNRDFLRVLEQLAAIDLSLASLVFIHNANGIRPLVGYATPTMRDTLLPVLAQGRELSAFALTEPAAGSFVPGIQTIAVPDSRGGWRIRGVKRWNGSGWAGIVSVFARLVDENGKPRHTTGFVVRQGMRGVRVGPESLTMGVRSIMQNAIIFDDVEVQPVHVLGEVGKGMEVADEALLVARLCMGALCLGGMKRCAQLMLRYASRRMVSTGRLLDSPITLSVFSQLEMNITLLQMLMDRLVAVMDRGEYPPEETCMIAKIVATDALWRAADDLVETLGGRGYMENNIAPQILRDCRMLRIGEGANELMMLSVGRRVIHSEPLHRFLRDELGAPEISDRLKNAAEQIQHRCLAPGAPFADRGAAVAWAQSLAGQVAIKGVLLAVAADQVRRAPSPSSQRALEWIKLQFETTLSEALQGLPVESLWLSPSDCTALFTGYADAIGNLEQAPPGVDEALDPLLRRDPKRVGPPPFAHLPGNANGETSAPEPSQTPDLSGLSLDKKRRLAAQLLQKQLRSGKAPEPTVTGLNA
jgi:alkylation response protein AidB-like acyl-CoA dehydrogenase